MVKGGRVVYLMFCPVMIIKRVLWLSRGLECRILYSKTQDRDVRRID